MTSDRIGRRGTEEDHAAILEAEKLIAGGSSLRAAASAVGMARSTLSLRLELGARVGRKPLLGAEQVAQAVRLRRAKHTVASIAAVLGVGASTVSRALARDAERQATARSSEHG